jgi:hypothetical protein
MVVELGDTPESDFLTLRVQKRYIFWLFWLQKKKINIAHVLSNRLLAAACLDDGKLLGRPRQSCLRGLFGARRTVL